MRTIAFDVMGNDNGVQAGALAAVEFTEKNLDYTFILVGDRAEINKYVKETERIQIIDVKTEVDSESGALAARHGDSSMAVAINLVKDGKADAVISSGDSGAYLSMATLILKRLEGVKRPAFMPVFPTIVKGKRFVMMDTGANLETTPEMLIQWAQLGNVFSKTVLSVKNPVIGLVNIGTEDSKGRELQQLAHKSLKEDKTINYTGFIEPRDLLNASVDVAIVDGYGGNLILKSMEGTVLSLLKLIKEELTSKTTYKMGALLAKGAFSNIKETLDYRNVGAAWVIGLNGLAIKTHGSSDKKAYLGSFKQVHEALEKNALEQFKKSLEIHG